MAKCEWQELLYWNHSDAWYFYSILRPNFSEALKIPRMFVKHFEPKLPDNVVLIGRNGKDWPVGLTKRASRMVFQSGWQRFVEDHSLQEGDVLLFRYSGDFRFNVLMFDKSGCEKVGAFFMNNINFDGRSSMDFFHASFSNEGLAIRAHSAGASENINAVSSQSEGKTGRKNATARSVKRETGHGGSSVHHYRRSGKFRWTLTGHQKAPRSTGRRSWETKEEPVERAPMRVQKRKRSNTYPAHSECPKHTTGVVKSRKRKNVRIPPGGFKSYSLYFLSNRRPVTDEELERTLDLSLAFKPANPSFHVLMMRTHATVRFVVTVPVDFVKRYLLNTVTQIILRVPGKKTWKVEYEPMKARIGGQLTKGWSDFVFDNSLEEGDAGVFEIVKTEGGIVLDVHIFRVVREFVPLTKLEKGPKRDGRGRRKKIASQDGLEFKEVPVKGEAMSDASG